MKNSLLVITTLITYNIYAGPIESMNEATQAVKDLNSFQNGECVQTIAKEQTSTSTTSSSSSIATSELNKKRSTSTFISKCFKDHDKEVPKSFKSSIKEAISVNTAATGRQIPSWTASDYHTSNWRSNVGLYSHPMCETVDYKMITRNDSVKNKRIDKVAVKMTKLAKHFNKLRKDYVDAIKAKKSDNTIRNLKAKLDNFYYELLSITASHESLTTADKPLSIKRAKEFAVKYGDSGHKKSPGVKYYYDTKQKKEDSKRNVGLFQFPMSGNSSPCVTAWNQRYGSKPSCRITSRTKKNLFKLLTAPDQVFNSFCGANKLLQSFGVQVNTNVYEAYSGKARRTHMENIIQTGKNKGKMKEPKNRCVSLFSYTLNTYNHYGTLGFTTSNNSIDLINDLTSQLGIK